ncbi:NAD-dependent epimerase/dehydratase [Coxiella burnetii]|uniref:UDP-glucose 4-epimerase n=1 Tax=Coxiella burnetii (strain Dugway 5J108-111) TaxID=434922 RepID=A9KF09_COXBN|nr:SDR family oxidoreductase [Coxiella burnetii]ABS77387.2 UDP-glucose 4-epimerase [Coxiella burnetii Dugway 5J108-111]OYK81128.1 NAD-dependent epimerase/dehydratase [Coxiella burnetii]OYK83219.1 NAD-dependent epimerase/dehydratase [Coxiella burnetii]
MIMETVLVTGAGGYIGSVLVPKLLNKGYHVKAVDRFYFGSDKLSQHPHLELINEDVRRLQPSLFTNVDYVIDLAAVSNDPSGDIFEKATWEINHQARVQSATLAKQQKVKRYILPSSCSIYGFQKGAVDETAKTNPLTTYAKANEKAEKEILPLATDDFTVTVMRQATVYGYSPRMRFDLAINGMVYGAWKDKCIPLMRDGTQYRPMVHVQDTTDVMVLLLQADASEINGQIINVGCEEQNYQLQPLGQLIAEVVGQKLDEKIAIEWYGDPDHRSYYVSFDKIKRILNWQPQWDAAKGAVELIEKLKNNQLQKTAETITLNWYQELEKWHRILQPVIKYDGILNIK